MSDDFRRVLSADGTLDGHEDPLDHLREQFRSIEREAARAGYLYEQPIRLKTGGVEHDVVFDYGTGTVLKFTKPAKAAYVVNFDLGTPKMVPGMPLEYLERLMLQNEVFGDSLRFVGLGGDIQNAAGTNWHGQRQMGLKTLSDHFQELGADFGEEIERRASDAKLIIETAAKYGVPVDMLWKPTGSAVAPQIGGMKAHEIVGK